MIYQTEKLFRQMINTPSQCLRVWMWGLQICKNVHNYQMPLTVQMTLDHKSYDPV